MGGHGSLISLNALIGGTAVAVHRAIKGEPVLEGFALGALGGGISYGGRVFAGRSPAGAVGRSIGAVGHSVIANSIRGRPPLSLLELPVGPLWLTIPTTRPKATTVKADAAGTVLMVWGIAAPGVRIDWLQTWGRGTVVLEVDDPIGGNQGVMAAALGSGYFVGQGFQAEWIHRHETIHILEFDFLNSFLGHPAEEWALQAISDGTEERFRLGLVAPSVAIIAYLLFPDALEAEADYLTRAH